MTRCRCPHNVPWFLSCQACAFEHAVRDDASSWDGYVAPVVRISETDKAMLSVSYAPLRYGCRVLA